MTVEAFFSQTYDEARGKFLAAAQARGLRIERHLHPDAVGPSGEQLSIDTALLAPAQAEALLIVTSGVHGVEGFCGSGCQTGLLQDSPCGWPKKERSGRKACVERLQRLFQHGALIASDYSGMDAQLEGLRMLLSSSSPALEPRKRFDGGESL